MLTLQERQKWNKPQQNLLVADGTLDDKGRCTKPSRFLVVLQEAEKE